jgi:hypothetical protein
MRGTTGRRIAVSAPVVGRLAKKGMTGARTATAVLNAARRELTHTTGMDANAESVARLATKAILGSTADALRATRNATRTTTGTAILVFASIVERRGITTGTDPYVAGAARFEISNGSGARLL